MATEKRLIDANEYCNVLRDDLELSGYYFIIAVDHLNEMPTVDAVEVVRCKDCKHCDPENRHCDHPMGTEFPFPRKADDYCSYGERKDNG